MLYDNLLPVGDDNVKSNNSIASRMPIEKYAPFGDLAQTFQQGGWYPTSFHGTEFKPQYGLFSDVPLRDGKGRGYVAIDHSGNGLFDLSIKDKDGKVVENIIKGANPKDIHTYLTNYGNQQSQGNYNTASPIAQRVNQIAQQQPMQGGTMASIF
jgi:hypothetical protein